MPLTAAEQTLANIRQSWGERGQNAIRFFPAKALGLIFLGALPHGLPTNLSGLGRRVGGLLTALSPSAVLYPYLLRWTPYVPQNPWKSRPNCWSGRPPSPSRSRAPSAHTSRREQETCEFWAVYERACGVQQKSYGTCSAPSEGERENTPA